MSPLSVPHNSFYSILKIIRSHWMVLHVCSHERFCNIVRKIVKNHNKLPKIYSASGVTSIIRGFTGFPANPKINLLFFTLYIMLSILADYLHPFHYFCRSQINHLVTFWMKGLYVIMFIFFISRTLLLRIFGQYNSSFQYCSRPEWIELASANRNRFKLLT